VPPRQHRLVAGGAPPERSLTEEEAGCA
jgi:hypothetical protein